MGGILSLSQNQTIDRSGRRRNVFRFGSEALIEKKEKVESELTSLNNFLSGHDNMGKTLKRSLGFFFIAETVSELTAMHCNNSLVKGFNR